MKIIEQAIEEISKVVDTQQKVKYIKAFRDSLTYDKSAVGDEANKIKCTYPQKLVQKYGLSLKALREKLILVNNKRAAAFLTENDHKISESSFRAQNSAKKYSNLFKRDVTKISKAHVYCYCELMHMVGHYPDIELPKKFKDILSENEASED